MKNILILILLCTALISSCILEPAVTCACYSNGQTKTYDFGKQYRPDLQAFQIKCDSLGAHDNLDTCRAQAFD